MSLQNAAEAVRQQGRGDDTMLIHMTPDEVKGLQALAMANGGSLTVNPETGLPEAGFLKSILPTLIGAGLAATGIGAPMAGLIVGGIQTARTGDLGQGILAGLGAYGGAEFGQAAAAAAAPTTAGLTPGAVATGLPGGAANVAGMASQPVATNLSTMGSGISNIFSSGATGEAARSAGMEALGGSATSAAMKGAAALAGPLSQPAPMPEVAEPEYNYDGPYKPTERKVRYPGPDRDPADSSEFQYFDVVNPSPGFEPIASSTPLPQNTYGPEIPRFAGIPVSLATNPDRMREYQANPNLYSFAEGGAAEAAVPPADYVPGKSAEFDYGFRQMAVQTPEIQQEATRYNPVLRERMGTINTNDGGGESTGPNRSTGDMGYIPGIAANVGRSYNSLSDLAKAVIPGAMTVGTIADRSMRDRGYEYNPITSDYEQRDYMGGGDAGYETRSGRDDPSGGYDSYSDAGKAASDRGDTFFRAGGKTMDDGGFVVDAHTVSEIGNGSSDAGHERLAKIGGEPIEGPGDGVSDSIKANIGGVQEARIARDESYLSKEDVKALGGGDIKKGEKMLYTLMRKAHESRKDKGRGEATGLDKLIARMA